MSYGSSDWQDWLLEEKESLEHIKFAYEHGINAFDTANVYSNGRSEEILGKAIKEFNMNRDEIVVMTCVYFSEVVQIQLSECMFLAASYSVLCIERGAPSDVLRQLRLISWAT